MYRPKFFILQELVPNYVYSQRGGAAWLALDDRLLLTLDALRYEFGPIIVNTWHRPELWANFGRREQSGLRTADFYETAADFKRSLSQHKYGRAADMLFVETEVEHVRGTILDHPDKFPLIRGVELGTSWLHIDCGNRIHITTF